MELIRFIAETTKISTDKTGITAIEANTVLENGLYITYYAAGVIAVLVIIIAGFYFMTSSYDPQKVAVAKNAILYAVIGLIVVGLAFVVTNFVIGRF